MREHSSLQGLTRCDGPFELTLSASRFGDEWLRILEWRDLSTRIRIT